MLRIAFEEKNIESRPLWKPLHLQPVFSPYNFYGTNVAEKLFENGLCLPSGPILSEVHQYRIQAVVQKLFGI
jgi:dTDP-4-amino-4,6-dideoxygalactose transaminase